MKTTIVPAQVTTVEDRIIGNLAFTQIVLLTIPLFTSAVIYLSIAPQLHLDLFKLLLILFQFIGFGILTLRLSGKIVAEWLVVYLRFTLRPRIYVYTKNDPITREVILPAVERTEDKDPVETEQIVPAPLSLSLSEQSRMGQLLNNPALSVSFELTQGGIDVSLVPIKR